MLVLSRKKKERIVLTLEDGRTIEVTTVRLNGERVQLGFDGAKTIRIDRGEVHDRKQAGKKAA